MRLKMTFKYDGSKFYGFQRLKDKKSIQGSIESALSKIYDDEIVVKGSGRTDCGVHANNQVCHFDVDNYNSSLKNKLNDLLMPDMYIKSIKRVSNNFHARKSVKKKEYIYKIYTGPYKASLVSYYYQPHFKLDISLMKEAANYMIGRHDFRNFVAGSRDDYITTINSITISRFFNYLEIRFVGTGFYRYMVRNLVGALLEVGKCKVDFFTIRDMIENYNVAKKLPTAPAEGLYLNRIWY